MNSSSLIPRSLNAAHASIERLAVPNPIQWSQENTISLNGLEMMVCLDGYVSTLVNTAPATPAPSDSHALLMQPPRNKRSHQRTLSPARSGAPEQQGLPGTQSAHSRLFLQLAGISTPQQAPSPPRPAPKRVAAPLSLTPERERAIEDALHCSVDHVYLIKPIYWPDKDQIVDCSTLRNQYEQLRLSSVAHAAREIGGMVDWALMNISLLWRQRQMLPADVFLKRVQENLTCPLSRDTFERPVLTQEGYTMSLDWLAHFYRHGGSQIVSSSQPIGPFISGCPNRRMAAISRALDFSPNFAPLGSPDTEGRFETGAMFERFAATLAGFSQRDEGAQPTSNDDPADAHNLRQDLDMLGQIDSLHEMFSDDGLDQNFRGELLHRAYEVNELLFRQYNILLDDLQVHGRLSPSRVRLATDAAMINAPVYATRHHFIAVQSKVFIDALSYADDWGSFVRRRFFEHAYSRGRREDLALSLNRVNVPWLQKNDPQALPYLQMAWWHMTYPSEVCRTKWTQHSKNEKLSSLMYSLWVEGLDFNSGTIFEPFENVMQATDGLASPARETKLSYHTPPNSAVEERSLFLGRSRASSTGSSHSSLRLLDGLFIAGASDSSASKAENTSRAMVPLNASVSSLVSKTSSEGEIAVRN